MQIEILKYNNIKILIIDQVDELLSLGFSDQIFDIAEKIQSKKIQIVCTTATIPPEVSDLATKLLINPVTITIPNREISLRGTEQFYVNVEREECKFDILCDLYETLQITQSVIFCNTRRKVDDLAQRLQERGVLVSSMTSENTIEERKTAIEAFRNGSSRVLLLTDFSCRYYDSSVCLIINYDFPNKENYAMRITRSGHYGRKRIAINFVTAEDIGQLIEIEEFYNTSIEELPANIADMI